MKNNKQKTIILSSIRAAVANYIKSEECGCCCNIKNHYENKVKLANLLKIPIYKDNSGYNFDKYVYK